MEKWCNMLSIMSNGLATRIVYSFSRVEAPSVSLPGDFELAWVTTLRKLSGTEGERTL